MLRKAVPDFKGNDRRGFLTRPHLVIAILAAVAGIIAPTARATIWYSAYFDSAKINTDETLLEKGVTYLTAKNGYWNPPSLFSTGAYSGLSLQISVQTSPSGTAPDGTDTDRFEYEWVQNTDAHAPQFDGVWRYWGFAFKIITPSQLPTTQEGIILGQMWQGAPYAPPVRLDVLTPSAAGDPWPNRLLIQNDDTGPNTSDTPIYLYTSTIPVETWYTYVIGIKPGWDGTGQMILWVNGVQVANYSGKIGYQPGSSGSPLSAMMVKSGIYRKTGNPALAFAYDNVKYGSSYSDAAP